MSLQELSTVLLQMCRPL